MLGCKFMSKPEQAHSGVARPAELEDWLNANLYHPLSLRVARILQNTFITPNAVSVAGGLMVVAAAVVYYNVPGAVGGILGLLFHMGWHVLDGADGDLARLTGRTSALGEVIDGACDYAGHLILYLTLAVILAFEFGWVGGALIIAAGIARAVQTVFFETQRRQYQYWVYGVPWLRVTTPSDDETSPTLLQAATGSYLRLSIALCAGGRRLDALIDRLPPQERQIVRVNIKAQLQPMIERLSILSSNYRTLVIGGAMIAGEPMIIVVFELLALGAALFFLWQQARRQIALLADQVSARIER